MKASCSGCGKPPLPLPSHCYPLTPLLQFRYLLDLTTCTGKIGKTSWFGCGAHIPGVLDSIPADEWCTCAPKVDVGGKTYPPKAGTGEKQ